MISGPWLLVQNMQTKPYCTSHQVHIVEKQSWTSDSKLSICHNHQALYQDESSLKKNHSKIRKTSTSINNKVSLQNWLYHETISTTIHSENDSGWIVFSGFLASCSIITKSEGIAGKREHFARTSLAGTETVDSHRQEMAPSALTINPHPTSNEPGNTSRISQSIRRPIKVIPVPDPSDLKSSQNNTFPFRSFTVFWGKVRRIRNFSNSTCSMRHVFDFRWCFLGTLKGISSVFRSAFFNK